MRSKEIKFLIPLFFLLAASCSMGPIAGGGTVVTNGIVTGKLITDLGEPATQTAVYLVSATYNPGIGVPIRDSCIDTTDVFGEYSFTVADTGTYTVLATHLVQRTMALIAGIVSNKDTTIVQTETLKEPGAVRVFLPDTTDTADAYVFMQGTTIFKSLSTAVADSDGLSIIIGSVPAATIPGIHYGKVNDPAKPFLIADTLQVISGDTASVEAFVFWSHYTQANSGLPGGVILEIYKANDGTIWFASNTGGVARLGGAEWTVYDTNNSQIPANIVHEIIRDSAGLMWFATEKGLASFNGVTWTTYNADNSDMPGFFVTVIDIDSKGSMWIGMNFDGLVKYNGSQFTIYDTATSNIADNNIAHLEIDANDNIWCGSSKGAIKFDGTSWEVFDTANSGIYANRIYGLKIDKVGDIWFCHENGVSKFDGAAWTTFDVSNSPMLGDKALSVCDDRHGNIWVGTMNGLTMYDGVQWLDYTGERWPLLNNIQVYVVYVDNDDNKWIGTFAKGVIGFGPTVK